MMDVNMKRILTLCATLAGLMAVGCSSSPYGTDVADAPQTDENLVGPHGVVGLAGYPDFTIDGYSIHYLMLRTKIEKALGLSEPPTLLPLDSEDCLFFSYPDKDDKQILVKYNVEENSLSSLVPPDSEVYGCDGYEKVKTKDSRLYVILDSSWCTMNYIMVYRYEASNDTWDFVTSCREGDFEGDFLVTTSYVVVEKGLCEAENKYKEVIERTPL